MQPAGRTALHITSSSIHVATCSYFSIFETKSGNNHAPGKPQAMRVLSMSVIGASSAKSMRRSSRKSTKSIGRCQVQKMICEIIIKSLSFLFRRIHKYCHLHILRLTWQNVVLFLSGRRSFEFFRIKWSLNSMSDPFVCFLTNF